MRRVDKTFITVLVALFAVLSVVVYINWNNITLVTNKTSDNEEINKIHEEINKTSGNIHDLPAKGIYNIGNMCHLNAGIQALISLPKLVELVLMIQ